MIAALIPARGGSKRLSRKNLRPFAGRPLIYHSIALAQTIGRIDCCIVSTEDAEIAEVASRYGAEVLERPAELAADRATTVSVVTHALRTLARDRRFPDAVVLLQPNCPLRPRALVVRAIELFDRGECDSVVSVSPTSHKIGLVRNGCFVPEYEPGTRSQDMPERCFENGLVYVAGSAGILESGSLFGARIRPLMTDPMYALGDIDTALDLEIAEYVFLKYRSHFEWATTETGDTVGAAR